MKERGRYQIQCMKSRSSTGVGQKIDLEYNIETMRITDPGLDAADAGVSRSSPSDIMNKIKSQNQGTDTGVIEHKEEVGKVVAEVQSNKLKQLLAQVKS